MSMPKYAARRDSTEADIVRGLEACGWDCVYLSSGDLPDLLVRQRSTGRLALLEVESGHYKRRRKQSQKDMLERWGVPIVTTLDEALRALGAKVT